MTRVLITPLDWGLGHATRCIPVIRELQRRDCEVLVAGSGDSLTLLQREYPDMKTFVLPAYRPRYPRKGSMPRSMAAQLPHFMAAIRSEHRVTEQIIDREGIHYLISDNRYGCWSARIPSAFITHQSNILMPKRFGWLQPLVRTMNDRLISRFQRLWIPDFPGDHSLAGELISFGPSRARVSRSYIGWLSRFQRRSNVEEKYDVLALFSGPEPQRTLFEDIVMPQLVRSRLRYRIVRGLPCAQEPQEDERISHFLTSEALQPELEAARIIIARSGFSTVMDLQALGKKAVFVPTPGQTEQEHIAKRLMEKGIAYSLPQDDFRLAEALGRSEAFSGFTIPAPHDLLGKALDDFLGERAAS